MSTSSTPSTANLSDMPQPTSRSEEPQGAAAPRTIDSESHPRSWFGLAGYGFVVASIYGLLGPLFFMGAKEKVFEGTPAGITKMFSGTFIDSFPGTDVAWFIVGLLEAALVITLVISLVRREFLLTRPKPWLLTTIALSLVVYAVVAFGDTITSQYAGTASMFTYFVTSGVLLVLVRLMPPYRSLAWLVSPAER